MATGISVIGRTVIENQAQNTTAAGSGSDAVRTQVNLKQVDAKVSVLQQIIDRYFLFDEDAEQMETGIYKGMLAGLGDPYTVYYTPDEYSSLTEETSGVYCGIGVLVSKNVQTGIVTALRVFPGSPAEEAGMQKGDIIYKVKDISRQKRSWIFWSRSISVVRKAPMWMLLFCGGARKYRFIFSGVWWRLLP